MSNNESLYSAEINSNQLRVTTLNGEIEGLEAKKMRLFDDYETVRHNKRLFVEQIDNEKGLVHSVRLLNEIKTAQSYSDDIFSLLDGTQYADALDSFDFIHIEIEKSIEEIENEIRQKQREIKISQSEIKRLSLL